MNGNKLFIDTNIILYLFAGDNTLAHILNQKNLYISFITQLEVLGFHNLTKKEETLLNDFISQCTVIDINSYIKQEVIKQTNKKL